MGAGSDRELVFLVSGATTPDLVLVSSPLKSIWAMLVPPAQQRGAGPETDWLNFTDTAIHQKTVLQFHRLNRVEGIAVGYFWASFDRQKRFADRANRCEFRQIQRQLFYRRPIRYHRLYRWRS